MLFGCYWRIMYKYLLAAFVVLAAGCTPSRLVVPLKKNEAAVGAGFGGPLIKFANTVIPIPFSSVNAGYGVTDKVTVTGGAHLTSLAFGVGLVETGVLFDLWNKDSLKQGLSFNGNVNTAIGNGAFRLWPQTDLNYYHSIGSRSRVYSGFSCWYELNRNAPHNEDQKNVVVPSWQTGFMYTPSRWTFQLEAKVIAPFTDNRYVVVDYVSPLGRNGAFGLYFTASRKFGK